ncbi:MAG: WG repeat-containing protein [Psychrobacter sp.]|uniref:WG repeat-containing protein n=1 Tax=Psychrobacter sp. AOP3-A1-26 TaxID=3457700 RepID=UPI003FBA34DA
MGIDTNRFNIKRGFGKIAINPTSLALLTVLSVVAISISAISPAYATINCAGYLPSSYFERIENNKPFAGKLIEQDDGSSQLQDLSGNIVMDNLSDAYIVMDKYVIAKQDGKYGVINAAGKIIVPFEYNAIQTEPDIATSFIVSAESSSGKTKQGIINRHGDWIYKLTDARIQHAHYDSDYDQDYFIITNEKQLTGLLDDRGYWTVMPQYEVIQPLNACTGEPLYLQVDLKDKTALINQNSEVIIPFAANQHIETFNNNISPPLFLRSTLMAGSTATGMSEDIQEDIISAQIIDAGGKLILSSDAPIRKLLYHQFYTYKQAGKFGIVDDNGDVILKPQFDSYRDDADKVWVEKDGKMLRLKSLIKLD